jgi:myo-inositol-1(or 4)-monophosphatase
VKALLARAPGLGIQGEEGATHGGTGGWRAVIDPIDGTAAFVAGLPTWCVCIGLLHRDRIAGGVVRVPSTGETFSAVGRQAWWNGSRLPCLGASEPPGDRFILADAKVHRRGGLAYPFKVRAMGSTAYHVVLVARGVAEGALLGQAHVWDLAAPGAILTAVGGRYEYLEGGAVDLAPLADGRRAPGRIIAAAASRIATLRPLLAGAA